MNFGLDLRDMLVYSSKEKVFPFSPGIHLKSISVSFSTRSNSGRHLKVARRESKSPFL